MKISVFVGSGVIYRYRASKMNDITEVYVLMWIQLYIELTPSVIARNPQISEHWKIPGVKGDDFPVTLEYKGLKLLWSFSLPFKF